jgi:hypothetical protein
VRSILVFIFNTSFAIVSIWALKTGAAKRFADDIKARAEAKKKAAQG